MAFGANGVLGHLLASALCLYCASLPGPWFSNEEATEIFPSWIIRVLVFAAGLWFFYWAVWDAMHHRWA